MTANKRLKDKNVLNLMKPASWHGDMWREGLPCGNGQIGAMVYGNIADETIMINHGELRHWGKRSEVPDISGSLAETRRLIDEGNFMDANWISANMLKDAGYQAKLFPPCPLCDIKIHTETSVSFSNYFRTLDMETSEVTVSWDEANAGECDNFKRRTFVSRTDDIFALKFEGTREIATKIFLKLHETFNADTKKMIEETKESYQVYIEGNYIFYALTNDDGNDFGAVAKINCSGDVSVSSETILCISGAPEITLFADFFINESRTEAFPRLKAKLEAMTESYDYYFDKHAKAHAELFNSCDISIADEYSGKYNEELLLDVYRSGITNELAEKLWRLGRYLMICGTRNVPFALYGIWGGTYNLMWSHNMANENLEMIYWHTLTGGLEYTMKPVIDYYTSLIEHYKINAKNIFGIDGIYVPAGSSPGMGHPNQIVPVIMNWTGAAGWLCQHFYNYYLYTGDDELLTEKILPFMENALLFYENFHVIDSDGFIKMYPSVSPENSPLNFFTDPKHDSMAHICPSAINATMDFAILKELLTNMLEIAEQKGLYAEKKEKWQDMLKRIPPYQINDDGAIREWMHPSFRDRYTHRHVSHIYPVFPATEYIKNVSDETITNAFETAVNKRVLGSQTGWSFAHMSSIYARFENGEKALDCISNLTRACLLNNFMTLHNDWRRMGMSMNLGNGNTAPMQLDANMGIVNAVQEMLLFVSKNLIKILPALPESFNKGNVRDFKFFTGKVSFSWNKAEKKFNLTLTAERDTEISVVLPDICNEYTLTCSKTGETFTVYKQTPFTVSLKAGESLIIS